MRSVGGSFSAFAVCAYTAGAASTRSARSRQGAARSERLMKPSFGSFAALYALRTRGSKSGVNAIDWESIRVEPLEMVREDQAVRGELARDGTPGFARRVGANRPESGRRGGVPG